MVGVPVADATQWDQTEIVGDCSHPIFKCLENLAAQGEVIFQDDTPGRILVLIAENQQARARAHTQGKTKTDERTGMQTTALIVQVGDRRIYLVTANLFERLSVPYRLGPAAPLGKRRVEFMYQKPPKRQIKGRKSLKLNT